MSPPITIRVDSALEIKRWTLHPDRLVIESRDAIVGLWSPQRTIFLDDIALVTYSSKRALIHLAWCILAAPFGLIAGVLLFEGSGSDPGKAVVPLAFGALLCAVGLWQGLKGRPCLRLRDHEGFECEARMDRPLLRPGKRRAFFGGLLRGLEVDLPRGMEL